MKNLMPISTKVYNLLIGEGIQEEEILEVMNNIQRDIAEHFEVKIDIEEQYFNLLQDIIILCTSNKDYTININHKDALRLKRLLERYSNMKIEDLRDLYK